KGTTRGCNGKRERQGLSLKKLGAMSGVSRTAIEMIEKGQRSPTLIICLRICRCLGPAGKRAARAVFPEGATGSSTKGNLLACYPGTAMTGGKWLQHRCCSSVPAP